MLEAATLKNPTATALAFFRASQPELLSAKIKGVYPPKNREELIKQHDNKSLPLLLDSALKGNLSSAMELSTQYSRGFRLGIDPIKSLAYLMAFNSVYKSNDTHETIIIKGDKLYPNEVTSAKKQAKNLIDNWNKQEYLTY